MLTNLFGARTFLDAEVEQWHLDVWATLIDRFGEALSVVDTPVALPTRDFFPPTETVGHAKALHVFGCVKAIMQMQDWPCALEAQPRRTAGLQVSEFVHIAGEESPNGTFRIKPDGAVVITYAPDLLDDPMGLVATLAHELAHYLLASETDLIEDETHELMTDLTVAYVGLGVFGANSAFSFEQHGDAFSQGWRSRSSGYLSPAVGPSPWRCSANCAATTAACRRISSRRLKDRVGKRSNICGRSPTSWRTCDQRFDQAFSTKLSITFFSPAFSNSTNSLLPSIPVIRP